MQHHDMTLNIHGEMPRPSPPSDGNSISREGAFLPQLKRLHEAFPQLRCILEHCSTAAALDVVRACGPTVAATITAHHLYLTGKESEIDPLAFCKPVPQTERDRDALVRAVCSGDEKFFFGSDSAPHLLGKKMEGGEAVPAGVFTQPFACQLVVLALEEAIERGVVGEEDVTMERLEGFLSWFGRRFYKLPDRAGGELPKIVLERRGERIPKSIKNADGTVEIGLSRPGAPVFSLSWISEDGLR